MHSAASPDGARMIPACRQLDDVAKADFHEKDWPPYEYLHRRWEEPVRGGAVAELAVPVVTPATRAAVGPKGAGVEVPCGDGHGVRETTDRDGRELAGGGAIAK